MRPCPNIPRRASTALLFVCGTLLLPAARAGAQSADGMRWSIFAGRTISSEEGADRSFAFPVENFGVGGSVALPSSLLRVPIRATLAYDKFRGGPTTTLKATSLTVDALFRPIPAVWGFRPYLLGGLGIATVSPSGSQVVEVGEGLTVIRVIPIARTTALEMNAGLGLDYRRLYIEYRHSPYGVLGDRMPTRTPIRLGFRF
jgi:hypothetical protein